MKKLKKKIKKGGERKRKKKEGKRRRRKDEKRRERNDQIFISLFLKEITIPMNNPTRLAPYEPLLVIHR
jgi:hypothetical protein